MQNISNVACDKYPGLGISKSFHLLIFLPYIYPFNKWNKNVLLVRPPSYLTYIKLCTLVKRNESMAHTLQAKLKEPEADENKRGPRPQDLIRLYDIILQVHIWPLSKLYA